LSASAAFINRHLVERSSDATATWQRATSEPAITCWDQLVDGSFPILSQIAPLLLAAAGVSSTH